jgi:hypothetical protein
MKHRLDLNALNVQTFDPSALTDDEAWVGSGMQCVSELSACGICPTETGNNR